MRVHCCFAFLLLLIGSFESASAAVFDHAQLQYTFYGWSGTIGGEASGNTAAEIPLTSHDTTWPFGPQYAGHGTVRGTVDGAARNFVRLKATETGISDPDRRDNHGATIRVIWGDVLNLPGSYGPTDAYLRFKYHGVFDVTSSDQYVGSTPYAAASAAISVHSNAELAWNSINGGDATVIATGWDGAPIYTQFTASKVEFTAFYNMLVPATIGSPLQRVWSLDTRLSTFAYNGTAIGDLGGAISLDDVLDNNYQSIADLVTFDSGLRVVGVPEPSSMMLLVIAATGMLHLRRQRKSSRCSTKPRFD